MVIRIKKSSHLLFGFLVILLVTLLFVRYAFSVDIPKNLITCIILAIAALGSRDEILAISLCCIPMHEAVDFYIALAICAVALAIKTFRSIRIGVPVILCLAIILWELSHSFLPGFDLKLMFTSLVPFIFLAVILSADVSDVDYVFIVRSVATVAIAVNFMLLLNCIANANFDLELAFLNIQRLGVFSEDEISIGGEINPNTLGIINVLCITSLLQLNTIKQNKKIDYILIILLITFGALTSSRTFLVCLLTMIFCFAVGQKENIYKKIRLWALLALVAIVSLILLNIFFPALLEYYVGRFQVEDITTGRDGLMVDYHQFIVENTSVSLFGVGLNNLMEKVVNIYRVAWNGPHNSIQEIIVAWGVPGLMMIVMLIFVIVLKSKKYIQRKSILNYIPLIIILVKSMAGQIITSGYTLLALTFAYLSLCQDFSQNKKEDNNVYSLGDVTPENNKIFIFRKG